MKSDLEQEEKKIHDPINMNSADFIKAIFYASIPQPTGNGQYSPLNTLHTFALEAQYFFAAFDWQARKLTRANV